MASKVGGFDLEFADSIHDRFVCSICSKMMKDPHLMICCGVKYCASCLEHWFSSHHPKSCPHCRARSCDEPILHALDKGMKREIESFTVRCTNGKLGCEWAGELRELEKHLSSSTGCAFSYVECPNECKSAVLRKDLQDHLDNCCELRLVKCPYCDYVETAKAYRGHEDVCDMYPMQCPKSCGEQYLVRCTLGDHLSCICPLAVIPCENASLGCEKQVLRKNMKRHLLHHCELREMHCEYCRGACRVKNYSTHKLVCEKYPMECPNKCGQTGLIRETLADHRKQCKFEVISCDFAHVGCDVKRRREDMPKHIEEGQTKHLELMTRAYQSKEEDFNRYKKKQETRNRSIMLELQLHSRAPRSFKKSVEEQISSTHILSSVREIFLRMLDYSELKHKGKEWISPLLTCNEVSGLEAQICLRMFFVDKKNAMLIQFRVVKVNTPFQMPRSIHLNLLSQDKKKTEVLSTVARIKLSTGCTVGDKELQIDSDWEIKNVVKDSLLWTVSLV